MSHDHQKVLIVKTIVLVWASSTSRLVVSMTIVVIVVLVIVVLTIMVLIITY